MRLENEECSIWPLEVDDQLRAITEVDPLKLHEKLLKNSTLTIIRSFGICSKLERWKCLISGCLMSWLQIKKMIVLKRRRLLFYTTMNHFSIGLWHVMKWVLYNWWHQLSGWTEQHLPSASQGQTCTKKGHGHCLMVCRLPDPLQLSVSQWNHYLWEVSSAHWWDGTKNCYACSQHWSTKWAQFSMKMPDCTSYNQCFRSWTNWAMKLCLICYIHLASRQLTTTSSSISTTFCRENASAASRRQKILRVCQILKHGFLHYRNKQIYFSLAKMYWL